MQSTSDNTINTQSMSDKARDWIKSIPFTTRIIFFLCCSVFLLSCTNLFNFYKYCFSPVKLLQLQFYTLFTYSFIHGNILHILMNMYAFLYVGSRLERQKFGSLMMLYIIILFSVLIAFIATTISYMLLNVTNSTVLSRMYYSCNIGLSGILFAFLEIECLQSDSEGPGRNRMLFVFTIPSKLYPWILLVLITLLMPGTSFIVHLSGIIIGYFYSNGWVSSLIPNNNRILTMESSRLLSPFTPLHGYIISPLHGTSSFSNSSSLSINPPSSSFFSSMPIFSGQGRQLGQFNSPFTLPYSHQYDLSVIQPTSPPNQPNTPLPPPSNGNNNETIPIDQ